MATLHGKAVATVAARKGRIQEKRSRGSSEQFSLREGALLLPVETQARVGSRKRSNSDSSWFSRRLGEKTRGKRFQYGMRILVPPFQAPLLSFPAH